MKVDSAELIPLFAVARLLPRPVAKTTLYSWVKRGCRGTRLATVRVGARHYVRPADLETFVAAMNRNEGDGCE